MFEGVRVLDLSRLLPGPFATLALADLGAVVDRLEEMGGEYLRPMPPLLGDTSGYFLALNRNKRSACIDLKKPEACAALLRLVESYDVLVEQFRPGVLDRLGLGHDVLLARNPKLIVCSITGYGQSGPDRERAGHDLNYVARAGLLGFTGGSPSHVPGYQVADVGGALWAAFAIAGALYERTRTGVGRVIDISMTEAAMGFGAMSFGQMVAGKIPAPGEELLSGGIAGYNTYTTKDDRSIAVAALEPKFWMKLCAALGLPVEGESFFPGPHQGKWKERLANLVRQRTQAEWIAFSREHDVCMEPVLSPDELTSDPQHTARKMFFSLPSPHGPVAQVCTPLTDRSREHRFPPGPGEHTELIFREAGFTADEIAAMRATQAVG